MDNWRASLTRLIELGYVERLCPRRGFWCEGKDREVLSEEDVPAAPSPSPANARVPLADADGERTAGVEAAKGEGTPPPDGLVLRTRDGRLRCRKDFQGLYERGKAARGGLMVLIYMPNNRGATRRGFVASSRVGSAVARNRCKRVLREAYRLLRNSVVLDGLDLVLIARPRCREASITRVVRDLEGLYRAAGLWKTPTGIEGDPTEA